MKIEYTLPRMHSRIATTDAAPEPRSCGRAPRIACLLSLAHRFEEQIRSGEIRDYADIARLGRVSRARISQILKLLTLAPSIQEVLLFLPTSIAVSRRITERDLRKVINEPQWDRQRVLFAKLLAEKTLAQSKPQMSP